jgi:hypothetical protein
MASEHKLAFQPRARILQLLGDELIGSPRLAVYELVKNAYDADASKVRVSFRGLDSSNPYIVVIDDGEGMDLNTIRDVWLVPGASHRVDQRGEEKRTPKYGRLPLGEKGLGRFAVHKLGRTITLITRRAGCDECVVRINWEKILEYEYLADAPVTVEVRRPKFFRGNQTGTYLKVTDLRQDWTKGEIRRLQRQLLSVCSPFEANDSFTVSLRVPGLSHWLESIEDLRAVLDASLWLFSFRYDGELTWSYEFKGMPALNVEGRTLQGNDRLLLPAVKDEDLISPKVSGARNSRPIADAEFTKGIGPVDGSLYVFDRDREIMGQISNAALVRSYLDEQGGVRVYRDGMRVYNYGEKDDDWLGLDIRRVNVPTKRLSNNILIGSVNLDLSASSGLVEKSNREGFVDSIAFRRFRYLVQYALQLFEMHRNIDKSRLRRATHDESDPAVSFREPLLRLKQALVEERIFEKYQRIFDDIDTHYNSLEEIYLQAGQGGLQLASVLHEVDRGVGALYHAIKHDISRGELEERAKELVNVLEGFSLLLRKDSRQQHSLAETIRTALRNLRFRLRRHDIEITSPILDNLENDKIVSFSFNFVLGSLQNIIENSLYWLSVRWPDIEDGQARVRKIYVDITQDFEEGPGIIIADNGPGYGFPADVLIRPFFSKKPRGMGLGLYYANMAMQLQGGRLLFPQREDVDLPSDFGGAVTVLLFPRK